MKRTRFLALCLLAGAAAAVAAPAASAADAATTFQKSFFVATKPGAWAKYEQTTTDAKGKVQKSEMTVSRLEGEGDRVWFEMRSVPKEGTKGKPTTLKYLLNTDFKVEKNALDYTKYIERIVLQADGEDAAEYPPEMLRQVGAAFATNVDYGSNVTPLGAGSAEGKSCDRYRIQGSFDVKILFVRMKGTTDSEICMSDAVPFGRVAEKTVTSDDKGKLMSTVEWKLVDMGTGAVTRIKGPVKKVELPGMPWGR